MEIEQGSGACANPECACTVASSHAFCGDHCRHAIDQAGKVEGEMRSGCACGHPGCDQPD